MNWASLDRTSYWINSLKEENELHQTRDCTRGQNSSTLYNNDGDVTGTAIGVHLQTSQACDWHANWNVNVPRDNWLYYVLLSSLTHCHVDNFNLLNLTVTFYLIYSELIVFLLLLLIFWNFYIFFCCIFHFFHENIVGITESFRKAVETSYKKAVKWYQINHYPLINLMSCTQIHFSLFCLF